MDFGVLLKQAEKFTSDNAPLILTVIGAAGTVTTAVLTAKATFSAAKKINDKQFVIRAKGSDEKLETIDKIKLVWPEYIPPVISCSLTVGAIVGANRISTKRAAALAAAYAVSQNNLDEYKAKVVDKLGIKKEQELRDSLAQDRVNNNTSDKVIITGNGEVMCFDQFTGRYFKSNMEALRRAVNDTNYDLLRVGYSCLSDFYERIGLPPTSFSEELGWKGDQQLELQYSSVISNDGQPCISFDFDAKPIRDYQGCLADVSKLKHA